MATKSSPVSAAAAPIVPKKKSCQVKGLYEAMIKLCTYESAVQPSPSPYVPDCVTLPAARIEVAAE